MRCSSAWPRQASCMGRHDSPSDQRGTQLDRHERQPSSPIFSSHWSVCCALWDEPSLLPCHPGALSPCPPALLPPLAQNCCLVVFRAGAHDCGKPFFACQAVSSIGKAWKVGSWGGRTLSWCLPTLNPERTCKRRKYTDDLTEWWLW